MVGRLDFTVERYLLQPFKARVKVQNCVEADKNCSHELKQHTYQDMKWKKFMKSYWHELGIVALTCIS